MFLAHLHTGDAADVKMAGPNAMIIHTQQARHGYNGGLPGAVSSRSEGKQGDRSLSLSRPSGTVFALLGDREITYVLLVRVQ